MGCDLLQMTGRAKEVADGAQAYAKIHHQVLPRCIVLRLHAAAPCIPGPSL